MELWMRFSLARKKTRPNRVVVACGLSRGAYVMIHSAGTGQPLPLGAGLEVKAVFITGCYDN